MSYNSRCIDILLDSAELTIVDQLLDEGGEVVVLIVGTLTGFKFHSHLVYAAADTHFWVFRKRVVLLDVRLGTVGTSYNWHLK